MIGEDAVAPGRVERVDLQFGVLLARADPGVPEGSRFHGAEYSARPSLNPWATDGFGTLIVGWVVERDNRSTTHLRSGVSNCPTNGRFWDDASCLFDSFIPTGNLVTIAL